jgi:putative nucleotidyltransferase with HDIG domain
MKAASDFLIAVAQAISTMSLYEEGHPARERAVDAAFERALLLQEDIAHPEFTFLGREIVLNRRPLADLKSWEWGSRLASVGIQRLEFVAPVVRGDVELFLEEVRDRLAGSEVDTAEVRQTRIATLRYGLVGVRDGGPTDESEEIGTATLTYTLREEADAVRWLHEEVKSERDLQMVEAEAVVRSLSVAMHGDQAFLIPLLRLKRYDQYTTTHALNVAVLSMALAESIGLAPGEVRTFGIAGLLHDLGKVRIPQEILNKPGKLTDREREIMNAHPVDGARIILTTEKHLDLAAVVAYEHHITVSGGGYPTLSYPRKCHQASDLVHVCDVYDALRTDRPYRDAWPAAKAQALIADNAGEEFHPDLAGAFLQMMKTWDARIAELTEEDQPIPLGLES